MINESIFLYVCILFVILFVLYALGVRGGFPHASLMDLTKEFLLDGGWQLSQTWPNLAVSLGT